MLNDKTLYTQREAARLLGVSEATVFRWLTRYSDSPNRLRTVTLPSGKRRIPASEIQRLVASQ